MFKTDSTVAPDSIISTLSEFLDSDEKLLLLGQSPRHVFSFKLFFAFIFALFVLGMFSQQALSRFNALVCLIAFGPMAAVMVFLFTAIPNRLGGQWFVVTNKRFIQIESGICEEIARRGDVVKISGEANLTKIVVRKLKEDVTQNDIRLKETHREITYVVKQVRGLPQLPSAK